MKEYEVMTQGEFDRRLPKGQESDWIEFAQLPISSGKLAVSDPMYFSEPAMFEMVCGCYHILIKIMTYPDDRRISRLRALLGEAATFGLKLDEIGVDFAQVGIFDPIVLDEVVEKMDDLQSEKFVADLNAIGECGVVHLGQDDKAVMPVVQSGFGDGGYPIHELVHEGKRVGIEVVFIGREVFPEANEE